MKDQLSVVLEPGFDPLFDSSRPICDQRSKSSQKRALEHAEHDPSWSKMITTVGSKLGSFSSIRLHARSMPTSP